MVVVPRIGASEVRPLRRVRFVSLLPLLGAAFAISGGAASAAELASPAVVVPAAADVADRVTRIRFVVDGGGAAEIDGDRGRVSRHRERALIEIARRINDRVALSLDLDLGVSSYRFDRPDALAPGTGRLLEEALRTRIRPGIDVRFGGDWSVSAALAVEAAGAPDADVLDATTLGGSVSVRRRFSSSFGLRVGLLVAGSLEGDPLLVPIVVPDDGDEESTSRFRVEVLGTSLQAGYAFTPCLMAGIRVTYDRRDWRLAKGDRVPEGIVRDLRVPVGLFVDVSPSPRITIGVELGVTAYQEIEVADRDGRRIDGAEASPSLYAGLSLTFRF